MEEKKESTHVAWVQHTVGGKFREWLEVGRGQIDVDQDGVAWAHVYQNRMPIGGWSGHVCLMPTGVRPPDPELEPRRPGGPLKTTE